MAALTLIDWQEARAQTPVACGQTINAAIDVSGEQDLYTFIGEPGDRIWVTVVTTQEIDPGFRPFLELYAPGIPSRIDSTLGGEEVVLPTMGIYTLRVREWSTSTRRGAYALRLEWILPVAKQCTAGTISCGQTVTQTLATLEQDLLRFTGEPGDRIWVTVVTTQEIDPGFRPFLELYAPGVPNRIDSTLGGMEVVLPTTGTYTFRVREWSTSTRRGVYSLRLEWTLPVAKQCTAGTISCGQTVTQTLAPLEQDLLRFMGEPRDRIWATVVTTQEIDPGFRPFLELYAPGITNRISSTVTGMEVLLPTTGTYTLRVREWSTNTRRGAYAVRLEWILPVGKQCTPSPSNTDLVVTQTVDRPVVEVGDAVTFTVQVRNASTVTATGVTLSDAVPDGTTLQSVASSSGVCSIGPVLSCALGGLAGNASALVTLVVRAETAGRVDNTAIVRLVEPDRDLSNNHAIATALVVRNTTETAAGVRLFGTFACDRPTVVLTHGLQDRRDLASAPGSLWTGNPLDPPESSDKASALIRRAMGDNVNIVSVVWDGAFQAGDSPGVEIPDRQDYLDAWIQLWDAGPRVARELAGRFGACGYRQPVQFIGHSLGTIVNAIAARVFSRLVPTLEQVQLTALDRPDHVNRIPPPQLDILFERTFGFRGDFFANELALAARPGLRIVVDNYYAPDFSGVGDSASGSAVVEVYNRPPLFSSWRVPFSGALVGNNHSGVQQWFRLTIEANATESRHCQPDGTWINVFNLDSSLNPCRSGWAHSILHTRTVAFPSIDSRLTDLTNRGWNFLRRTLNLANFSNVNGCYLQASILGCSEGSAALATFSIDIPSDAGYLWFEYQFPRAGDGDFVTLYIDGLPVWMRNITGETAAEPLSSGPIAVRGLTGARTFSLALSSTGVANAQVELRAFQWSPAEPYARYFAEGSTSSFMNTGFAILNPTNDPATVWFRFLKIDGSTVTHQVTMVPRSRFTLDPKIIPAVAAADFSTVVESTQPVVVDRTMSWDARGYGSHAESSVSSASATWYLAEGSTSGPFNLFYLLQNPQATEVVVAVEYLLPFGGSPILKTYRLLPNSRTTIWVNNEAAELATTDVSGVIRATQPIIVERSMYASQPGQPFAAGHASAGVMAPSSQWFLAEGATGPFFDLFVLIANPNDTPSNITAEYLLLDGARFTKDYVVPPHGRFTIYVDAEEIPAGTGNRPLSNVAVSTSIRSINDVPVIVERAMWWPGPTLTSNFWYEAHNSAGATETGIQWALADGEVGGSRAVETYILIANTSHAAGTARVTLLFEDGSSAAQTVAIPAHSRTNVSVSETFPAVARRRFGALVESLGEAPAQIVVERAMYSSADGVVWAAGTNVVATKLQ